jgi:hypothetical protein
MLFTLWSSLSASTQRDGRAGGLQILCCQGIKVTDYDFTLDALALKPSDFCSVRVYLAGHAARVNIRRVIQCKGEEKSYF